MKLKHPPSGKRMRARNLLAKGGRIRKLLRIYLATVIAFAAFAILFKQ